MTAKTDMKTCFWLLPAIALSACGSEPPPPYEQQLTPETVPVAEDQIVIKGNGIAAGPEAFFFAAGRAEVETALGKVLGPPEARQSNDECGAGPMEFTRYEGGLSVNFQEDRFVGWFFDQPNDAVATQGGMTVGTPREEVTAVAGFTPIEDSTLGEEFALGQRLGGFLDEDGVSGLYAGTNCFFR